MLKSFKKPPNQNIILSLGENMTIDNNKKNQEVFYFTVKHGGSFSVNSLWKTDYKILGHGELPAKLCFL